MDRKAAFFCLVLIIILSNILVVNAAATTAINTTKEKEQVDKAYNWLLSASENISSISPEDIAFSMLALSFDSQRAENGKNALIEKSNEGRCWPKGSCTIKNTALALLALSRIGEDTSNIEEWLNQQNGTPTDLTWYVQIDSAGEAKCTLSYNDKDYNVTLKADKKLDKAAGSCLMLSDGNYWYRISSACYDKTFSISCDPDFIATLFYKKPGSNTIYISSDTKKESAKGSVDLRINAVCLKSGSGCDYEGTAWASLALIKKQSIATFLPYLVGYADKNARFMPNAFLFILTGQEDYAKALLAAQKRNGYWQVDSPYSKYYDTALALLALQQYNDEKKDLAKNWLLNEQVKSGTDAGSWGSNKKDTSFILYALWEKESVFLPPNQKLMCIDTNYYCLPSYECRGEIISQYECAGRDVCCNKKFETPERTCSDMGGKICDAGKRCAGTSESAKDGWCCMGDCEEALSNDCEEQGYSFACKASCADNEEENPNYGCGSTGMKCCEERGIIAPIKRSRWWIWLLLLLLIIGGAAAYYYFFMGKKGGGKKTPPKPFFTPQMPERRIITSHAPPAARPSVLSPARRAAFPLGLRSNKTNKMVDETLSRLRRITEGK